MSSDVPTLLWQVLWKDFTLRFAFPIVLVVQTEHCADCRSTCLRMLTPLRLRLAQKHLCHQHNDVG